MEYLSVKETADRWGVSERTVRYYCAQGRVAGARMVGKIWNIPADSPKPPRANAKALCVSPLLEALRREKASGVPGGIYHRVQVDLTYNSNHIEGSRLTLDQTRFIFETATFGADGEVVNVDDVVETVNHFRCIDLVIDCAEDALSEHLIKKLHLLLKTATSDSNRDWFAVGDYKRLPNEVGGRATTAPEDVEEQVSRLIAAYEASAPAALEDIVAFHVAFERIHPFQDGNGRVGRLIMFKECLRFGITPFVIADDMKFYYYRGLGEWDVERGFLLETCQAAQDRFADAMARLGIFRTDGR